MVRKSVWLVSAGLFALSFPAHAQTAPETDTDGTGAVATQGATAEGAAVDNQALEQQPVDTTDIIVTSTRRNEALSDVPLAVSAVTAETLENTGATDIRQLQQVSPSLLVTSTQSEAGASTARIRGIGTVGDNPGLESSVGVFIDGVYRSRTGVGLTELGPLDRVEVLRGPQGTLFGRNTSAGLISIITARPRYQPEVAGELTVGNYNMRRVELSATGGMSDTVAARLDGVYVKRDGFVEDLVSGRDVNNRDRGLLRGQLLFEPSEDLSLRLIADYSKRDEECCAAPYLPASDFTAAGGRGPSTFKPLMEALGAIVPDDPFERKVAISEGRSFRGDVKDWGLSAEGVYDFGGAELTSITAYRDNDLVRGTDVDYSNLDLVYRPDDGSVFNRFKTFTQEIRLQGEAMGGKLDWLVGGYYARENLRSVDSIRYGEDFGSLLNCYSASNFAALLRASGIPAAVGAADVLVTPGTDPTCFNRPIAAQLLPILPAAQRPIFAAFARLGVFAPGPGSPFGNSGFENLIRAQVPGQGAFALNGTGNYDDFRQKSNNIAVFTHNIFSLTDALKVTVGARYTRETKRLDAEFTDNSFGCNVFSGTALAQLPCANPSSLAGDFSLDGKRTESKVSGTAVLSYKPTDQILTYLSYSRGYKAGGFNLDRSALSRQLSLNSFGQQIAGGICPPTGPQPAGCLAPASSEQLEFRPEINDAVELGLKYNGAGIDVNIALFHQLFRDFQLNTFNGVNFVVENINSCEDDLDGADTDNVTLPAETGACTGDTRAGVKSRGVEFELFSRPMTDVNFNFGATLAETRYRNNLVGAGGRPLSTALFQLPGRRVSNAAGLSLTSSLSWTPPIGGSGMRALFYVDARHQSEFNTGSDLDIEKIENGFTTVNGRVGLRGPDQSWAIELWAQNLLNANVKQIAFDAFLQGNCTQRGAVNGFCSPTFGTTRSNQLFGVFLGEPRMYGLTLRGKFGAPRRVIPAAYVAPPAPPPPPPATQTCADGSVILATDMCPAPPPPPPPPPVGERG